MATDKTALATLESMAGDLTKIINKQSIAYQVCDVQYATTPNPSVFGVRKGTGTGLEIVKASCNSDGESANSDEFTEEVIDDIFNLYGENAENMLKAIAANTVIDEIDTTLIGYMKGIATQETALSYDFGTATPKQHIDSLILEINKIRVDMAKSLQRGLPKYLIVSSGIASLLITNKLISGNDSDYIAGGAENVKLLGKLGDMIVFHDLDSVSDYILFLHKTYVPGDASVILAPIYGPRIQVKPDAESGEPHMYFKQRFAYSQNPLDTAGSHTSDFVRSVDVTISNL